MTRPKKWFRDTYREALWQPNALRPNEVLVGLAYAEYAGQEDVAWVAWTTLSDMTGMRSRTTISAAIRGLVDAGWLVQIEPARQHKSPRYRLTIPTNPDVRHLYLCDPPSGPDPERLDDAPDVRKVNP